MSSMFMISPICKKRTICAATGILIVVLSLCAHPLKAQEMKRISNKLYSIEVPKDWVPSGGMKGDGTTPGERDMRGYHLCYFAWQYPIKGMGDIPNAMMVDIQSYRRIDGKPTTMKEIEVLEMSRYARDPQKQPKVENLPSPPHQKRFLIVKESKEMDGSLIKYRHWHLMQQNNEMVHYLTISLRDDRCDSSKSKMISIMLDSFGATNTKK